MRARPAQSAQHAPAPLPPDVAALAARHGLGGPVGVFRPRRMGRPTLALHLFTLTYLLVLIVPPVLYVLWLHRRYPEFSRKQAAKRLWLFEEGLIAHPFKGDGPSALRWDSVSLYTDVRQTIVNGIPGPVTYAYTLVPRSGVGGGLTLTEFYESPAVWGPWIQEAVARAQAPSVLHEVAAGEPVRFGGFQLSRTGLAGGGKPSLPWDELQGVEVVNGRVRVMRTGDPVPWGTVDVSRFGNLAVFLTVAENLGGRRTAG
ncbi:DUF6585 family protein [uncultured Streptomyces sp.]|uniref:DUF6585 family protein n=1 Tax=uncultured Streptomyces sp. TaxID=174707 RepID=UPI00261B24B2|nr:DUF6585 family protein [uncultured Streptomyces sp.]